MFTRAALIGLVACFICMSESWAQNCPAAPGGSSPGWTLSVHKQNAKLGGMMPDAPSSTSRVKGFPLMYSQIPEVASAGEIPKLEFRGNFIVCEPGRYDFTFIIEAGPSGNRSRSLLCKGYALRDTTKVIDLDRPGYVTMVGPGLQKAFTGTEELEKGVHPLDLVVTCGAQSHAGRTSLMTRQPEGQLLASIIALRVRGPKDDGPRDFRPGEIVARGRN